MTLHVQSGESYPLGATVRDGGVNFSIFSQSADSVELLLFDSPDAPQPAHTIKLDPRENRTFYYWHVFVPDIGHGQCYAFRAHGPFAPEKGLRFDGQKVLVDPYAKAISTQLYSRSAACRAGDNCAQSMRSIVVDTEGYDWEGDAPLHKGLERTIIYEMHVAGFTRHPSSQVSPNLRGTFAGLIEKIPYLQELGINAVELLPIHQFDEDDAPGTLTNYWGYSSIGFFAPHDGYASGDNPEDVVNEFRDMVKALHRAGIAVYLDVVYNHSAEGGADGPTLSFRGLENVAYYIPGDDPSTYANYSGCGNTISANHSIVRRMIVDSLRYWVKEMHIDGFRFDLASAMARGEFGEPLASPPLLWEIESDPLLAGTVLVAEAWDAAGHYQVGSFIGDRYAEWNDRFRDDVRRFVRGDEGMGQFVALRMLGSPDIYTRPNRQSRRSINFVTCHDGFTMNDLVSYNHKHNQANGEQNRDGSNHNHSWNCGVEGPTKDPTILTLRAQQIRNFMVLLLLSQGTPMLLMGDEVRHTRKGNNNVYGQNNELAWFNWEKATEHDHLRNFVRGLVRLNKRLSLLNVDHYLPQGVHPDKPYILFHGRKTDAPAWERDTHWLVFTMTDPVAGEALHVVANMHWGAQKFEMPNPPAGQRWRLVVDTSRHAGENGVDLEDAPFFTERRLLAPAHSCHVFVSIPDTALTGTNETAK